MRKLGKLVYIPILVAVVLLPASAFSSDEDKVGWGYIFKSKQDIRQKDTRIGPNIRDLLDRIEAKGITRENIDQEDISNFSSPNVRIDDSGNIQSYVFVNELNDEIIRQLEELGMIIDTSNEEYKVIQGWIPFHMVEKVSTLGFVIRITTPDYAFPRTGSVNTEGDAVIRADDVRNMLGITGSGVKVGVISDGIDNADSAQATGDLPDIIDVNPSLPGNGDEGTALLEIIYDIAPGTGLAFSGAGTNLEFIDAIEYLVNQGVDVIVDDLGFLGEPYFEDGPVAESAGSAVQSGVVFVSAAGNGTIRHYQHLYVDTNPEQTASEEQPTEDLHDFGLARGEASDVTLGGVIAPGRSTVVVLQWNDDPQGNTLDGMGSSSNDYDLIIDDGDNPDLSCTPSSCASVEFQDGDDDPLEAVLIENANMSNSQPYQILINRFSGQAKVLEMYTGSFSLIQNGTEEDSVFGHPAVAGVIAVGAVPANDPDMVEDFSSRGPSTIFFPSFEERDKPDVVAPDNVSVTGAGGFSSPFSGTSASAPHVAGVAALLLDADSTLTPGQLKQVLQDTAIDINTTGTRDSSSGVKHQSRFNSVSGFGLVDAFSAVSSVLPDSENVCDDGVDNDGDGNTDCDDPDCADASVCADTTEICDDGIDNDGDGAIDCADIQCQSDPACMTAESDNGGSGGCTVIADTEGTTSAVNMLLIILSLAAIYVYKRKLLNKVN